MIELRSMGIRVQSQVSIPVFYRGKKVKGEEFEIDLLVENELIVQIVVLERVLEFHRRQMLLYLQVARKPMGLLINFEERVFITAFEGASPLHASPSQVPSATNPLKKYCSIRGMINDVHADSRRLY
jgi:GxxExxY protein